MKLTPLVLAILLCLSPALRAAGVDGDVYLLGIALDQEGAAGGWAQVGPAAAWKETIAGTVFNGKLFTIEKSGALYETNPANGAWKQIGKNDFGGTHLIFASGDRLYTIETSGSLYRVNPADGTWAQVGKDGSWKDTLAGTVLNGRLYTIEKQGNLWETNLETGDFKPIGKPEFGTTRFMFASGQELHTIASDGSLYRVNPTNGGWAQVGPKGAWKATTNGVVVGGRLYTTESDGRLYATDLRAGNWREIGKADFGGTSFMFPVAGQLYTIETSGNLYRVSIKADKSLDSFDWCPQEAEKVFREQGREFYHQMYVRQVLGASATRSGAMDGFAWLREKARKNDMALVFIDAHGETDLKDGWGIWTADAQKIWGREIKAELAKLPCRALVMVETCTSGGFAEAHANDPPLPANVTAICACQQTQSTNNQLDLAVSEALYGRADFNGDGVVDLDELIRYVNARYKEWWPNPKAEDAQSPVIVKSKEMPGSEPLTRVSPALSAVAWQDGFWSALVEKHTGDQYAVHLLGWSSRPGEPYFITNTVPRDAICLPADGKPMLVEENGTWRPARLVSREGGKETVHLLGANKDEVVGKGQVKYPFVGEERK